MTPSCAGRWTDRHGELAGRCVVCPLLGGLCFAPPVEVFVSCPQWRSLFRAPSGGLCFVPPEEVFVHSGGCRPNVHADGTYLAPVPKDTVVQVSCPRPRAR